jgi:GTP-binding protein HflX
MEVVAPSDSERTLLVGLVLAGLPEHVVLMHLDELERLVDTAGGMVVGRLVQDRQKPDPATLVGSGFAERIADYCVEYDVQTVVFDEDLSPSQARNLESCLPKTVKVIDRASVILDIFAQRARTREAQTQVELAQLTYLLPRLTRRWGHLSRQAGGIGTRGVGETQLEVDRRLVSQRISQLKKKLRVIERDRRLRRDRRSGQPTVALVGYTNAGKSSLFKCLTGSEVLVEDRLFATLDPRARRVALGEGALAVLTDTVGFIRKLPHHLVAPFRSTLEEAAEADVILHVIDGADLDWETHQRVGEEVLESLGVEPQRVVLVLNKIDLATASPGPVSRLHNPVFRVSALRGDGLEELRAGLRCALLGAPGITLLKIPLGQTAMVEEAIRLPHRLAQRFRGDVLEIAARINPARLAEVGLDEYCVAELDWSSSS